MTLRIFASKTMVTLSVALVIAACSNEQVAEAGTHSGTPTRSAEVRAAPSAAASQVRPSSYPVTVRTNRKATRAEAVAARPALAREFAEVERLEGHRLADYTVALADLNGDGRNDMIVQVQDFGSCGMNGCDAYVILATPTGLSDRAFSLGVNYQNTITVLASSSRGMHDLRFDGANYTFRWNGKAYQ